MPLPKLTPGKRHALARPPGSADALLLAQLAQRETDQKRLTAIVCADASDARRLQDELAFFAPGLRTALLPDWETLPYDTFSPHQDLISERLATLWAIKQRAADIVLLPATTALYRLAPPSFLAGSTFHFKQGQKLDDAALKSQLALAGYSHVTQVVSPGEYAVRGGLIDLFPMGSPMPYRVDLFDDEIDSIRGFDPDTQRSLYPVPEVRLLPGREFPMDDAGRTRFRQRWRELLEGDPTKSRLYKDMGLGVATAGIEYYLPLFFDATATVFDYFAADATLVLHGDLQAAFEPFAQDTRERYRLAQGDPERPVLPPDALFLSAEQFYLLAEGYAQVALRGAPPSALLSPSAASPLSRPSATLSHKGRGLFTPSPLAGEGRGEGVLSTSPLVEEGREQVEIPALPETSWLAQRARELRKQQTPHEHALWQQLRAKRFSGYTFRRQQPLGHFIVDFVCFPQRLIVELDGGQHADAAPYDTQRDAWLKQAGFRVLRFWNNEWATQQDAVLETIWRALQEPAPLPNPSPAMGEGLPSPSPLAGEGLPSPSPLAGEGRGEGVLSTSPVMKEGGAEELEYESDASEESPSPHSGLHPDGEGANTFAPLPDLTVARGADDPLARLHAHLRASGRRALVLAESDGRRESLLDFLRASGLNPPAFDSLHAFAAASAPAGIATAALAQGFAWLAEGIDFITETELFAAGATTRRRKKQERASDVEALIKDLSELGIGDPVVHAQHGIGRYRGLIYMDLGEKNADGTPALQEMLHLEYASQAVLYVPVSQLHLIGRYTGVSPDEAPLHKLGSGQWEKAKRKAAQQVRDAAAELLNIYARRAAREGFAFRLQPQEYEVFANDFGFEETPDQQAAIHAVIQDMISPQPMDRLVCGDVGFGKTEVALRAAFVAVTGGKQVALLAPTTLLAEQHHQTLCDRFAKWPVKVAELSRFRSAKEVTAALKGIADGSVDIVVGTHKLLGADVKFKSLGLLVIDEEHRFGVRHKEAMKALRAEVDVLTLTATPIPRTMGMALEGLRDLSVIATAPQRRLAIKTFVRSEGNGVIREAVLRELKRGGQVYFLHNEVETIENRRAKLQELLPEARIAIAHGQLPERELERVMRDFVAQRHNLLLCSTIIETGIDVPTANTIVISRADKFGLAQLHQLRGRVGRSHHQAYAYLMVPDLDSLTKQAGQRLEAIQQMEELGSGFYLAMHDLEIRGAGEVLGENQSGNMMEIGFQLYNDMLAEAVKSLKAGREPDLLSPLQAATDINLHAPALLPEDYCGDVHLRLSFYKKLATASSGAQIDALLEEIVDRFGKLPPPAQTLIDVHRLRVASQPWGVQKVDAAPGVIHIGFKPNPPIDPLAIVHLIQKNKHIKLAGNDRLRIEKALPDPKDRAHMVRDVLRSLGQPSHAV